jgi:hypothetical protein
MYMYDTHTPKPSNEGGREGEREGGRKGCLDPLHLLGLGRDLGVLALDHHE